MKVFTHEITEKNRNYSVKFDGIVIDMLKIVKGVCDKFVIEWR